MTTMVKSSNPMRIKKNMLMSTITSNISGWVLLLPSVILFVVLVWRPIIIGMVGSFFKLNGYDFVKFVGLKNIVDVLSDTAFLKTLWNTVQYVLWSLVIGLPMPIIAAILLNEMVHAKSFMRFVLYFPLILPAIAVSMIWYFMYLPDMSGFLNMLISHLGVAQQVWLQDKNLTILLICISMTWHSFGGTMIYYIAALQSINQELYEAAKIDGAGIFRRIWHVLLPHISGTLLLMAIMQIISVFQVMEQPMTMTGGGPNEASMSLGLQAYNYAFTYYQMDKALALGMVTFVLLIGLTYVYFKLDKKISD